MSEITKSIVDKVVQTFIEKISNKYNIKNTELTDLWNEKNKCTKRSNNGKTEEYNIIQLVNHLNNSTDLGKKLISSLYENMNITFKTAECRPKSNRKSHYDFIIIDNNGRKYQVEHKGSFRYKKIKDTDTPWKSGVQFVNAGCEKFDISHIYAKLWYDKYISSKYLSDCYKLSSDIPTFNTWYKSDCCTQGDPKSKFSIELKTVCKKYEGKSQLSNLRKLRKDINNDLFNKIQSDSTILDKFTETVINLGNTCLLEKDLWLQINGNINDNVDFKWYGKILLDEKYTVNISMKSDFDFDFISTENKINFKAKLRWGKGCGFSNLRIDLK